MYMTYTRHRVKNYDQWRKAFDDNTHMLTESGITKWWVVQINGDPTDVAVIVQCPAKKNWDDFIAAHTFAGQDEMRKAREKGGVIGDPEWWAGEVQ